MTFQFTWGLALQEIEKKYKIRILSKIHKKKVFAQRYKGHRAAEPQPKEFSHRGTENAEKRVLNAKVAKDAKNIE